MVSNTNHYTHSGYLLDDTPRGLLEMLLIGGGITVALSVAPTLLFALAGVGFMFNAEDRAKRRKIKSSFQYIKKRGYVKVRTTKTTRYIEVTPVGKVWLERLKARERLLVPIVRPKTWDKKWRLILFDISAEERAKRNAFRGLIRRLGAVMFQKSVWAYPFDCSEQIELLTDIFGFSPDELRLVIADSIGDDKKLKAHFKLSD